MCWAEVETAEGRSDGATYNSKPPEGRPRPPLVVAGTEKKSLPSMLHFNFSSVHQVSQRKLTHVWFHE